jgi:hypothetical protein
LTGYPTLLAHHLSIELLYPMHLFHSIRPKQFPKKLNLFLKSSVFPRDYHLVNFRTLDDHSDDIKYHPSKNIALILRRFAHGCGEESNFTQVCIEFQINKNLCSIFIAKIQRFLSKKTDQIHRSNIFILTTYKTKTKYYI